MVTYVTCKCTQCGKEYSRRLGDYNHNKGILKNPKHDFCSPSCFLNFVQRNNIKVNCEICGNEIIKTPSEYKQNKSKKFYCNECRGSITIVCPVCKKTFKRWKSQTLNKKTMFCSKGCKAQSQKKEWNNLDRRYLKNRWVSEFGKSSLVCSRCGHDRPYNIELHHKIYRCNGGTHHIENLEPLCKNCHGIEHYNTPDKNEIV